MGSAAAYAPLYLLSAGLALAYVLSASRANPRRRLPWWGCPPNRSTPALLAYFGALFSGLLPAAWATEQVGVGLAHLIYLVAVLTPVTVITLVHNRRTGPS